MATWTLLKALLPYVLVQCAVTAIVFVAPWTVHQLDAPVSAISEAAPLSEQELDRQMREMGQSDTPDEVEAARPAPVQQAK